MCLLFCVKTLPKFCYLAMYLHIDKLESEHSKNSLWFSNRTTRVTFTIISFKNGYLIYKNLFLYVMLQSGLS